VRNITAQFHCAFCSTDGPAHDSTHTSIFILRIFLISYVIRGCLSECLGVITFVEVRLYHCKNSLDDLFRFRFYSSLCICLTPLRSSQGTAIRDLFRYDTYRGDTKKATPASVQGVYVDFYVHMDFASPYRLEACSK
jgi:hypothetical protein